MQEAEQPPTQVAGVRLAAGAAGIRYAGRDDLVLVETGTRQRLRCDLHT